MAARVLVSSATASSASRWRAQADRSGLLLALAGLEAIRFSAYLGNLGCLLQ